MNDPNDPTHIQRQVWLIVGAVMVLYGLLRLSFGTLPQDPSYHLLADTRTSLGVIPRAGDVLTNLAILAAGLFGLALRTRMTVAPEARTAVNVLIAASILTAFGSAYYHWAPTNATLIWDRLPMALVLMALLVLVMQCGHSRRSVLPASSCGASPRQWGKGTCSCTSSSALAQGLQSHSC
jgi:hypothetical protein